MHCRRWNVQSRSLQMEKMMNIPAGPIPYCCKSRKTCCTFYSSLHKSCLTRSPMSQMDLAWACGFHPFQLPPFDAGILKARIEPHRVGNKQARQDTGVCLSCLRYDARHRLSCLLEGLKTLCLLACLQAACTMLSISIQSLGMVLSFLSASKH